MKSRFAFLWIASAILWPATGFGQSPSSSTDVMVRPPSSVEHPSDAGVRAHTNHLILVRPQKPGSAHSSTVPVGETPGSLACVYQTSGASLSTGCPVSGKVSDGNNGLPNASGGSKIIAIVDAFDYPTADNDFYVFSQQFGLPCTSGGLASTGSCPDQFQKVYATGTQPSSNCGWAQEAALDIEWAHAMAPNAKIILVEAASNSFTDLLNAVDVASGIVTANGGSGEVSMSWGGSEFLGENLFDSHFQQTGVVYFAASGDSGGHTLYPSVSPYVVSAGGTTVNRDGSGNFLGESAWSSGGGGPSNYELRPSYQNPVQNLVGSQRGTPDFSFDANPNTGVWVYDSTACGGLVGWLIFGGTSVSSPSLSGIVNLAGSFGQTSPAELGTIDSICGSGPSSNCSSANFRDITSGRAGHLRAQTGWDFATGVGSNLGPADK